MMFGEFKVLIQEKPSPMGYRVFLYLPNREQTTFITHDGTYVVKQQGEKIDEGELYFADMSSDMLHAFAEALANKGIKTNADSIAQGKLAATERHLEDMRLIALAKYQKQAEAGDASR